ncbi:MAG: polysaccharide biosynthesis/export family protein [Chthoniobacteraceae bacterium]
MRFFTSLLLSAVSGVQLFAQAIATVRPGDTFEMRLGGVPIELAQEFNAPTYSVSQEGTVNVPLIGEMRVSGLTPTQVEKLIQTKLISEKLFTHPSVNITPAANSRVVTIGGGVRAPQRLVWSPDLTLRSAIDLAGGLSDWGSLRGVRIIRNSQQTSYDARKFDKDPSLDPKLLPGDQIVVPQ